MEGTKTLTEARKNGFAPTDVFVCDGYGGEDKIETLLGTETACWTIDDETLSYVSSTVSPQPVLATVPFLDRTLDDVVTKGGGVRRRDFFVVGVEIADPGNAGTLIRNAAAAGANGIVFTSSSVDIYNPKVVRASAGTLFSVPIATGADVSDVVDACRDANASMMALSSRDTFENAVSHTDVDFKSSSCALFLGNESKGLPPCLLNEMDRVVCIEMAPGVESLNVAAASAVACFEAKRQRDEN